MRKEPIYGGVTPQWIEKMNARTKKEVEERVEDPEWYEKMRRKQPYRFEVEKETQ